MRRTATETDEPPISPLDLAPSGVSLADPVAWTAGALLPHRFTLPCFGQLAPSAHRGFAFCCTFLRVAPTGR